MDQKNRNSANSLIIPRLNAFLEAMRALRSLQEFVQENLRTLAAVEDDYVLQGKRLYPSVDPSIHRAVADFLHPQIHLRMSRAKSIKNSGGGPKQLDKMRKSWAENVRMGILAITNDPDYLPKSSHIWDQCGRSPLKTRLLRNSLLMGAVSDFEVLVSGLVRAFLTLRPEILRSSDQKYSFADLQPFSTIEEFQEHCIENMAEVLLRGGFDDWMEWFGKKRNIKVPGVTEDAGALVEIFQRRHLLVHNGGVVNKFYLSKVSGPELPVLGDRLHVGTQYLENSVDELTVAGVKLSFSLLQKMAPNEVDLEELSHRLEHLSFDLLSAGYFRPVFSLNDWHLGFVKDSERRLIVMVNKWIAMKKMGLAERVCIEVAEWDTATLSGTYRLAKLALIDDNAAAYSLVKAMISAGELRRESWRDWPLLEGVREFELKNIGSADKIWVVAFGGEHTHPNTEDGRNAEA